MSTDAMSQFDRARENIARRGIIGNIAVASATTCVAAVALGINYTAIETIDVVRYHIERAQAQGGPGTFLDPELFRMLITSTQVGVDHFARDVSQVMNTIASRISTPGLLAQDWTYWKQEFQSDPIAASREALKAISSSDRTVLGTYGGHLAAMAGSLLMVSSILRGARRVSHILQGAQEMLDDATSWAKRSFARLTGRGISPAPEDRQQDPLGKTKASMGQLLVRNGWLKVHAAGFTKAISEIVEQSDAQYEDLQRLLREARNDNRLLRYEAQALEDARADLERRLQKVERLLAAELDPPKDAPIFRSRRASGATELGPGTAWDIGASKALSGDPFADPFTASTPDESAECGDQRPDI